VKVQLRAEHTGDDHRYLDAYLEGGDLHIDGHDLGPQTALISSDGEYEWWKTIDATDIPRLVELLGGDPGEPILALLERDYTGPKSYDFERILRESGIEQHLRTWSG